MNKNPKPLIPTKSRKCITFCNIQLKTQYIQKAPNPHYYSIRIDFELHQSKLTKYN